MASSDFTALTDGVDAASFVRGVTQGITPPPGGGSYVYAFNSVIAGTTGASGLKYTGLNFDPHTNGGRISAAMKRLPSGGVTGFAPMIYLALQGSSVNNTAYMLGLQDNDPSNIVLRKGTLVSGLPDGAATPLSNGILRRSAATYDNDTWVHVRLDVEVTGTGDVVLNVYQNDLDTNDVDAPVWAAVAGMDEFVDDVAQINTGSAPLTGGRSGIAFYAEDITRRVAFDHITLARQL